MAPTRRAKIPVEQWEHWKTVIEQLFLQDNCTLDELVKRMSREHQFHASKSQYEARFRRWGISKNMKALEWLIIAKIIRERKFQNKKSEVYRDGKCLERSQVDKEISRKRNVLKLSEDERRQLRNGELPAHFEIRTPRTFPMIEQQQSEDVDQAADHPGVSTSPMGAFLLDEVDILTDTMHSTNQVDILESNGGLSLHSMMGLTGSTSMSDQQHAGKTELPRFTAVTSSEWSDFVKHSDLFLAPTIREKLYSTVPSDSLSLLFLRNAVSGSQEPRGDSSAAVIVSQIYGQALRTIIPARHSSNLADMTQGVRLLHIAINELVNNHRQLNENSKPVTWVLSYLQDASRSVFERLQKCLPQPYSRALYRNLFRAAVEIKAFRAMQGLLLYTSPVSRSLFLSDVVSDKRNSYTITMTLFNGQPELSELLIESCDKPTTKVLHSRMCEARPIYSCWNKMRLENMNILLSKGFQIQWSEVAVGIIRSRKFNCIQLFFNSIPHPPYQYLGEAIKGRSRLLRLTLRSLSEEDALWTLRTILQGIKPPCFSRDESSTVFTSRDPRRPRHPGHSRYKDGLNVMDEALTVAIARNFQTVIDFLISAGARATATGLDEAICTDSMDLIKKLLATGTSAFDVFVPNKRRFLTPYSESIDAFPYTTPYATAIRMRNLEALRLFEEQPRTVETVHARLANVVAASEIGDYALLEKFLSPDENETIEAPKDQNPSLLRVTLEAPQFNAFSDAMHKARRNGHKDICVALFNKGVAPTVGMLEDAILSCDKDMIALIFENLDRVDLNPRLADLNPHLADLNPRLADLNPRLDDFVLAAMRCGDRDFFLYVLDCIDIQKIQCGGDLIIKAIELEDLIMIKDLLHSGIQMDSPVSSRHNPWENPKTSEKLELPIVHAIRKRNKPIIHLLLESKALLNKRGYYSMDRCISALEAAAATQDDGLIRQLLDHGADPCDSGTMLKLAAAENWTSFEILLEAVSRLAGFSKRRELQPVMTEALRCNNVRLLRYLVCHTDLDAFSVNSSSVSPLDDLRARFPNEDIHAVMSHFSVYSLKTRCSMLGIAMLVVANRKYALDAMRIILQAGGDPEAICFQELCSKGGNYSYTPLNWAGLLNSKPCIDLLLEYHANLNKPATNASNRTTLQLAVELGRADMVHYLIGKGADINAPPAHVRGFTALQLAAREGFVPIAEFLIDQGADVNAPAARIHGKTAFEAATESGRLDMMLLLVRSGVDLVSGTGEKQFARAIEFATAQAEIPAVSLAHELREKALQVRAEAVQESLFSPLPDLNI